MDKKELTQIVKAVQRDKGQFELLYSQIINKVYFWCYTLSSNEAEAKDMAQEAMIRIYNKIDNVEKPEYFTSWMYKVVRNSGINYMEQNRKKELPFLDDEEFSGQFEAVVREERKDHMPKEAYDLKETKKLISKFIDNLPKMQREVITLFYLEEMKINEIAETLDYNIGSVKSRLYSGRKNLELQISDYQEKNNVKLYSIALLPLLGLIIQEYSAELCDKQDLAYDESIYTTTGSTSLINLSMILSAKVLVTLLSVFIIVILLISFSGVIQNKENNNYGKTSTVINEYEEEMEENLKGHPYIKGITYSTFPTRTSVDVSITLKQELAKKDISILFDDEEIYFEKSNKIVRLDAKENGEYTIIINSKKMMFTIDRIDSYAPEVTGISNYGDYIQLYVNDELSQIDYSKSYLVYQGKDYAIPNNLTIDGKFQGMVEIILFNKEGYYIEYNLNLK
ncbi:RNA polymerase sigma factor [Breznakia pachnodae]|uniref:RNA polymerase sigma factor (Sigma-70 family) n=1 Tax=Breznakia pachnodae TaxID=265178 RepID=A0ABU0E224_9FIRM|nr:RNA polymerase sigma factor [Breznakia pachnodae]MDQ0360931.1 RNA polymerase sigma factor (sigma-70 family) [Breznakia pachnodae]